MDSKIKKDDLLEIVRENMEKHRGVFEKALEGWREAALTELERQTQELSQGKTPDIHIILSRPRDHTPDYRRVIRMLELDTRDEIVLTEQEVGQYVMDQWRWTRDWLRMSNSYAAGATQQAYGVEAVEDVD